MAYPKTETKTDFSKLEREMMEFWRRDDTFHKSLIGCQRYGLPLSYYAW